MDLPLLLNQGTPSKTTTQLLREGGGDKQKNFFNVLWCRLLLGESSYALLADKPGIQFHLTNQGVEDQTYMSTHSFSTETSYASAFTVLQSFTT